MQYNEVMNKHRSDHEDEIKERTEKCGKRKQDSMTLDTFMYMQGPTIDDAHKQCLGRMKTGVLSALCLPFGCFFE